MSNPVNAPKMPKSKELESFFSFAVSVDCVLFGFDGVNINVLLIYRGAEPYPNMWAVPGDLVRVDEDLDTAAKRILSELTGLDNIYLEQVHTFGAVDRHPLGRVLTTAFFSLVDIDKYWPHASSWAQEAEWHDLYKLPDLAFDHRDIVEACLNRLRKRIRARPIGFELLPEQFTLSELQTLYECIMGLRFDKRNFRKKILSMGFLNDLNLQQKGVAHRPAKLYSFDKDSYDKLVKNGFSFAI